MPKEPPASESPPGDFDLWKAFKTASKGQAPLFRSADCASHGAPSVTSRLWEIGDTVDVMEAWEARSVIDKNLIVFVCLMMVFGAILAVRDIEETGWRNMPLWHKLLIPLYPLWVPVFVLFYGVIVGVILIPIYLLIVRPIIRLFRKKGGDDWPP
jgi:hypothetical protein